LTSSPTSCVLVPRHVVRLVVDYFDYVARPGASARRAARHAARRAARHRLHRLCRASGCLGMSRGSWKTTSSMLCDRVPPHVARLVIDHAPSRRSTSRRSVAPALDVRPVIPLCVVTTRLAVATDILRLHYASGCLDTSRGSSSTTSTTPRVRVPRHVARLVKWLVARLIIDYIDYAARPGASARRAARR
jgi:hypothetical protein